MADVLEGKRGHGRQRSPLGLESGPAGAALATMQVVVVRVLAVLVVRVLAVLVVRVLRRRLVILAIVVPLVAPAFGVFVFVFIVEVGSEIGSAPGRERGCHS